VASLGINTHIKPYLKYGYWLLAIPVFFLARYYYYNDPETGGGSQFFARCPFHFATGFHCPGCGSQRAAHDLLHFRLGEAIQHNLMLIIVVLIFLSKGYALVSKKFAPSYYYNLGHQSYFTTSLVVVVFAYWIMRNIPVAPFTYLAP
jgi:hypothetical protein